MSYESQKTVGDLTEEEASSIEPATLEHIIEDMPNGFFSGVVGVDESFSSMAAPVKATDGRFQLHSTFTPTGNGEIPSDLRWYLYQSTGGRVSSGPVHFDGTFEIYVENIPFGEVRNLEIWTHPQPHVTHALLSVLFHFILCFHRRCT